LQPLIDNMLAKDAAMRYADCRKLIAAIDVIQQKASALHTLDNLPADGAHAAGKTAYLTVIADARADIAAALSRAKAISKAKVTSKAWAMSDAKKIRLPLVSLLVTLLVLAGAGASGLYVMRAVRLHQQVNVQLKLAEQSFEQEKYLTPENDSAVFYYHRALQIDPKSREAAAGLRRVAAKYEELARKAFAANRYDSGMALVDKGLQVVPDDAGLLALKKEQQTLGHPTTRFFRRLFH
jgi:tetratricopeptide (TPR) repeat protein